MARIPHQRLHGPSGHGDLHLHPLVMTSQCPETITHHINGKRNRREAAVPGVSGRSLLLGAPEICFVQSFQHHLGQIPSEI